MESPRIDRELTLMGPKTDYLAQLKEAFTEMEPAKVLRIVVREKETASEILQWMEYGGHKVLESRRLEEGEWELLIQKQITSYTI